MSMTDNKSVDMAIGEALRRKIEEENKSVNDIDFILVGGLGLYVDDF